MNNTCTAHDSHMKTPKYEQTCTLQEQTNTLTHTQTKQGDENLFNAFYMYVEQEAKLFMKVQ